MVLVLVAVIIIVTTVVCVCKRKAKWVSTESVLSKYENICVQKDALECVWVCVCVMTADWHLQNAQIMTFPIFRTLLLPLLNTDKIHSKKYIQKSSDVTSYFSLQVASLHNWEETIFSQWVRENCRFTTLLGISGSILYQHRVWIWVWISTGKGRAWFTDCLHSTFITYLHSLL